MVSTNSAIANKVYFEHLDIVRFLSAFMIVISHSYEGWIGWFGYPEILSGGTFKELTPFGRLADTLFHNLSLGVDVFFFISGFLITYLLLREKETVGRIAIGKFLVRRVLRIWPLYFFLMALAPILVHWLDAKVPNYWANALFIGNFATIQSQSWDFPFPHFWSICIEEHFYLVWPFVIAFIPGRHLLKIFLVLILFSIGYRVYAGLMINDPWFSVYLHTLSRMDVLIIGAIGAYFYAKKPFQFQLPGLVRYGLWVILLFSLSVEHIWKLDTIFAIAFKKYFYIAILAALLLDFNFNQHFKYRLPRKSIIHYFGKVSYGIYLYSNILILIIIKKIMQPYGIFNMWLFFALNIGLSLLIPVVSYELFEKHILKLNKRFRVILTDR